VTTALIVIAYVIGVFCCAYLFTRLTGDLEPATAALLWPIALPLALFIFAAVKGEEHHR
jgi:hypothetical protein